MARHNRWKLLDERYFWNLKALQLIGRRSSLPVTTRNDRKLCVRGIFLISISLPLQPGSIVFCLSTLYSWQCAAHMSACSQLKLKLLMAALRSRPHDAQLIAPNCNGRGIWEERQGEFILQLILSQCLPRLAVFQPAPLPLFLLSLSASFTCSDRGKPPT